MSVLVKGMKMPTDCVNCPAFKEVFDAECRITGKSVDGHWSCILQNDVYPRPDWCFLIEVPDGHGRLIDADAFISRLEHCEEIVSMLRVSIEIKEIYFSLIGEMKEEIENVPTVISADKEET